MAPRASLDILEEKNLLPVLGIKPWIMQSIA
jgi:hypothetical protein